MNLSACVTSAWKRCQTNIFQTTSACKFWAFQDERLLQCIQCLLSLIDVRMRQNEPVDDCHGSIAGEHSPIFACSWPHLHCCYVPSIASLFPTRSIKIAGLFFHIYPILSIYLDCLVSQFYTSLSMISPIRKMMISPKTAPLNSNLSAGGCPGWTSSATAVAAHSRGQFFLTKLDGS